MLLATAMVARAFDFSEAAPTGQTLHYTITSGSTVKVVSGTPKPTGRLVIPATAQGYSVTEIDRMAFSNCTGLTSVSIPGSVTTIGMRAFAGCSSLTSAFLAEGVQSLAMMVFSSCTALDTVSLPTTITQLAAGCFGMTAYMTNGSHWQDSVLYVGRYLVAAQSSRTAPLIVANSTLGIANDALEYCHISKCVLPSGLHFIGDFAFKDCQFLDTVRLLGATPPSVGGDSFQGTSTSLAIAVPCNSAAAYSAAQHWSQLNIVEDSCPEPPVAIATAQRSAIAATVSSGILHINGAQGQPLTVCDIAGRRILHIAAAGNDTSVALPAKGVYIVSVGASAPLKVCYL